MRTDLPLTNATERSASRSQGLAVATSSVWPESESGRTRYLRAILSGSRSFASSLTSSDDAGGVLSFREIAARSSASFTRRSRSASLHALPSRERSARAAASPGASSAMIGRTHASRSSPGPIRRASPMSCCGASASRRVPQQFRAGQNSPSLIRVSTRTPGLRRPRTSIVHRGVRARRRIAEGRRS